MQDESHNNHECKEDVERKGNRYVRNVEVAPGGSVSLWSRCLVDVRDTHRYTSDVGQHAADSPSRT